MLVRHARVEVVPVPTQDAVRAHLAAILSSSGFANADRISRFLRYTVEMKLRGEEAQIKEYVLGREVFDRGEEYDPRLDPIVRVEARRLRQRLAEYYEGVGKGEEIRIDFPKGSYAPVIGWTERVAKIGRSGSRRWMIAGTMALMGGAVLTYFQAGRGRKAKIAVIPALWVWGAREAGGAGEESLAEAITARLANQGRKNVMGWPVVMKFRGEEARDVRAISRDLGVATIAIIAVRRTGGETRATVYLLDAESGQKGFAQDYAAENLTDSTTRDRIAGEIAAAIEAR